MKKITLFLAIFLFTLIIGNSVDAKSDKKFAPSSEDAFENSTYDVEGHPELKLKVVVHYGKPTDKPGKPTPPSPTKVCAPSVLADPDSSAVTDNFGVTLPATWRYRLNSKSAPASIGPANLAIIASDAFGAWKSAVGDAATFIKGDDTIINRAQLDSQNIIAWGRTSGSALAVSYLWYYPATGKMSEVDTIMNQKFTWAWSNPSEWPAGQTCAYDGVYDAQDILTHEFGHTVGLNDEYDTAYANNTMYGYGSKGETKKDTLTTGDLAGVKTIYP